jgi:circadian clock protein KaiC
MNTPEKFATGETPKVLTGIQGLDQITRGGLPRGKATLVTGGPGCGKTVFGLQNLANGALLYEAPGIFVAFEENSRQIIANAASFGWDLGDMEDLFFLDAMLHPDTIAIGEFDFSGMLELLGAKARAMKAKRIVLDSLDVLLHLMPGAAEKRREMNRLHGWLVENELSAIITAKLDWQGADPLFFEETGLQYMPFIVDCVIVLAHQFEDSFSQRRLRIMKYRGSSFGENEAPFIIGPGGIEVASFEVAEAIDFVSSERISCGVEALDRMLGGGIIRTTTTIITGEPGTAKTTLAGAFCEAANRRGERTLYVAFDESAEEIVRNVRSVGIDLQPHLDSGLMRMHSGQVGSGSAEEHLLHLKSLVQQHQPSCMVIDPFSAFAKIGTEATANAVAARLIRWVKSQRITLVCTSIPEDADRIRSGAALNISTVADTWVHISFLNGGESNGGEWNRALTVFKSRGTRHSNQVRELILSDSGITIAEPYTGSGPMLMGTMRWQKERTDNDLRARLEAEFEVKRIVAHNELAEVEARLEALQRTAEEKRLSLRSMSGVEAARKHGELLTHTGVVQLRQGKKV